MTPKIIDKTMFREMPWANGGGTTTELIAHHSEQSGRMLWRLSMAGVSSDGPFSRFSGYDRVLVLMSGQGLRLCHQNGTEQSLSSVYDLVVFPGDVGTHATLVDGPIQDFNVITDRTAFVPAVVATKNGDGGHVKVNGHVLAVFAVDNDLLIVDPGEVHHRIPTGDLLVVDLPQHGDWTVEGATAIVTQLRQVEG
ncbi:MAG: HutD family protein [Proteobacteria bacterium]|nr:HutD family protein [Pseudomonadota bacterium]MDA0993829.1 HutD family protein [Pseudomonadota bacterium]